MKAFSVHEKLVFHDKNPYAEPLVVDEEGRILRFMLKPGQSVVEHAAPNSPVYIMVIQGTVSTPSATSLRVGSSMLSLIHI